MCCEIVGCERGYVSVGVCEEGVWRGCGYECGCVSVDVRGCV